MNEEQGLRTFILERRDGLTRQQQKLAAFVLENMAEIPFLPVPVLARKANVSEATVVRFSQRLGFDGYSGLKAAFVDHLHGRTQETAAKPSGETTLDLVLGLEISNLQKCAHVNHPDTFAAASDRIAEAKMIFCFGLGASSIFAEYAAYSFNQIGLRAMALSSRISSPLELLVTFEPEDHLCVFSFPPYSESTIKVLEATHARGISATAFCDRASAPVARWADHTLIAPSEGMMFTNSMAALVSMINALITDIGKKRGAKTLEAVDFINKALKEDPSILSG